MNKLPTLASGNECNTQHPDSHVGEGWRLCQVETRTKEWLSPPGYLAEAGSLAGPEGRQEWKHFWGGLGVMLIWICVKLIVSAENTFPFICWLQIRRNFRYTLCCTEQNILSHILFIMLKLSAPSEFTKHPFIKLTTDHPASHGQPFFRVATSFPSSFFLFFSYLDC